MIKCWIRWHLTLSFIKRLLSVVQSVLLHIIKCVGQVCCKIKHSSGGCEKINIHLILRYIIFFCTLNTTISFKLFNRLQYTFIDEMIGNPAMTITKIPLVRWELNKDSSLFP